MICIFCKRFGTTRTLQLPRPSPQVPSSTLYIALLLGLSGDYDDDDNGGDGDDGGDDDGDGYGDDGGDGDDRFAAMYFRCPLHLFQV